MKTSLAAVICVVVLSSSLASGGAHSGKATSAAGIKPLPFDANEFLPCHSSHGPQTRRKVRFEANHVHDALVVLDDQGGWRLAEAGQPGATCVALLTGDTGRPLGPVRAQGMLEWGNGHREPMLSFVFGAMLDGTPRDRFDLQYIAMDLPGLPVRWIPSPCLTRGDSVYALTTAPDGDIEISGFYLEGERVRQGSPKQIQRAIRNSSRNHLPTPGAPKEGTCVQPPGLTAVHVIGDVAGEKGLARSAEKSPRGSAVPPSPPNGGDADSRKAKQKAGASRPQKSTPVSDEAAGTIAGVVCDPKDGICRMQPRLFDRVEDWVKDYSDTVKDGGRE